ncbi:Phosphoglycerate mutase family protein [Taphrina deformans PYCC 5710]|uniref:Phosphoglycerate mutase family protein n=1 Tax=Taphrina deformans (strain PYCC 5710 / ATCC 11124 / CBS 356.35 / IMI 108563 / JCM 9778 / NBRC 8474) TaxID=1097556 RepID=R4XA88_TAPDE|nr:Phosphoglycerate mutase family protein [Taphrina deformans PYCC 5710]|eukprot:CCG82667.1 Phosphoglycerate mutase family protein [Taphrina deformans PYCC 5710]
MPSVFIVRHGQTEWSEIGKRTSFTDLSLTKKGEELIQRTASRLFGSGNIIDPALITKVYVSPRARAQETLKLLNLPAEIEVETTELLAEFDYGEYEGMKTSEIKRLTGNDKWETWVDEAPGAETPAQVQKRIDELINLIREKHHAPAFNAQLKKQNVPKSNVLLVAHGHILRGFGARWIGAGITTARALQLDAGGVGILDYEHHCLEEPAINRWNVIQ